ncbi:hypothetical protein EK21DRAFT_86045 [Setomelanomma holmii]|uniref:Uncharacterized protein n=1 Tax=Setomelanomma holmii TaxID=210430 RepID=A0A9P4HEZ1_9PLEO|nr:hypothetical protein EK21DRAFT_86045 [Setomelanomma holmii]
MRRIIIVLTAILGLACLANGGMGGYEIERNACTKSPDPVAHPRAPVDDSGNLNEALATGIDRRNDDDKCGKPSDGPKGTSYSDNCKPERAALEVLVCRLTIRQRWQLHWIRPTLTDYDKCCAVGHSKREVTASITGHEVNAMPSMAVAGSVILPRGTRSLAWARKHRRDVEECKQETVEPCHENCKKECRDLEIYLCQEDWLLKEYPVLEVYVNLQTQVYEEVSRR